MQAFGFQGGRRSSLKRNGYLYYYCFSRFQCKKQKQNKQMGTLGPQRQRVFSFTPAQTACDYIAVIIFVVDFSSLRRNAASGAE